MSSYDRQGNRRLATALLWSSMLVVGCAPTLESRYADSRGASINGVSAFVEILRQSGRNVDVWPAISARMQYRYQTLIVFDSKFDPLPARLCRDLEEMIIDGTLTTLVVVVRDSDAAVDYWRQMRDRSDSSEKDREAADKSFRSELALFQAAARPEFDSDSGTWYGLKRVDRSTDSTVRTIECASSEGPFSVEARWLLNRRLEPRSTAELFWKSGDDPLLTYEVHEAYDVFVLGSATPLLNGGLVDPGNRRLAAEFTKFIPETGRVAVALSSRWHDSDETESPSILQFLKVHPNGWVFGQGILAMLLFCWSRYPIFGRPRESISVETARFGRHVEALGNLLRRTRNTNYARQRIRDWLGPQSNSPNSPSKPN
ncbi:DUF4350 domain-containing protein [Schlesneria paludicola]|uniref:DUF4350 domain-containing protein n=1 Tax=Schlesneria paludicola TaxID=360056 RepID=UPI00029B2F01|nr:DUF4350 domain-containing protein [Schlesneria paludicola]